MSDHLVVGQRVQTPLGLGTITGFEYFYNRGYNSATRVEYDTGGQVAVTLDNPENWSLSAPGVLPYIYRSQLSGVNES